MLMHYSGRTGAGSSHWDVWDSDVEGESQQRGGSIRNSCEPGAFLSLVSPLSLKHFVWSVSFNCCHVWIEWVVCLKNLFPSKPSHYWSHSVKTGCKYCIQSATASASSHLINDTVTSSQNWCLRKIRSVTLRHYTTHANSSVIDFRVNKVPLLIYWYDSTKIHNTI